MLLFPERNLGLFVSFNASEGAQVLRTERFMHEFMAAFFPQIHDTQAPPTDFAVRANEYSGIYFFNNLHDEGTVGSFLNLADAVTIRPTEDGRLRLAFKGAGHVFTEITPNLFERSDGEDMLAFHRDAAGEITGASLNSRPVFTLIRRAWFEPPWFAALGVSGVGIVMIAGTITGLVYRFRRNRRDRCSTVDDE